MEKFMDWFGRNRITIGYTVGGINIVSGLLNILIGNVSSGIIWLIIGAAIVYDTKYFK